jgi:lipid A disaccharide synthetase
VNTLSLGYNEPAITDTMLPPRPQVVRYKVSLLKFNVCKITLLTLPRFKLFSLVPHVW